MNGRSIGASYAHSSLWIVFFFAAAVSVENVAHLVFFDIVHGDQHRTRELVISVISITPVFGAMASVISTLVFTPPQIFQVVLVKVWERGLGNRARFYVLPALPFTAILTWYCCDYLTSVLLASPYTAIFDRSFYDYLTPSSLSLDWTPYQRGISTTRYLEALLFQAPVTLFSFFYYGAEVRSVSKWPILIATLTIVIVIGCVWGYVTAQQQIAFFSSRR